MADNVMSSDVYLNYLIRHRQEIINETIRILDNHFRTEAEKLLVHDKFEEAADMFNYSIDDDENIIDALRYLLYLCRVNVLENIIADFTSSSTLQELCRLHSKAI